ncbi:MAG: prepilin-type N-terminal cleavage/methylation domain-containing protein [Candidatus Scalindua sp.]|nr:prepilin-type N-terminal cleavage/methylation domain-containing protein [Candidatus Scalindua sp.]
MRKLYYKGRNRGFTLTELVVTMSIVSVLASLAVVGVGKVNDTKRQTTCINNMRAISQALQLYYNDFRVFPDDGYPYDVNDATLSTELASYLKDRSTFVCPEDNDTSSTGSFASYDPYYIARNTTYGENELAIGCPRHRDASSSTSLFTSGGTEVTKTDTVLTNGQEIPPDGTTAQRTISSVNDEMTFADGSTVKITSAGGVNYGCFLVQSVRLADGTLYSIIKVQNEGDIEVTVNSGSKFEVVTPSAIVGVRGTHFNVTTTDLGNLGFRTHVSLTDGTVVLMDRDTGKTTTLTGGGGLIKTGTVDQQMHSHPHWHADGTYHEHSHGSVSNAHHGNPAAAKKAAAASTDADVDDDGDNYSENEGDCDDTNVAVYPGATDIPGNGIDEDCDGQDATTSGNYITICHKPGTSAEKTMDIDESDLSGHLGHGDFIGTCSDGDDDDGDGYTENEGDCDDADSAVHPGAIEIPDNGIDDDCDPDTADSSEQDHIDFITDLGNSSSDVSSYLVSNSPLSDTILNAMFYRANQMDDSDIKAVLMANYPLSDNIMIETVNTNSLQMGGYWRILLDNSPLSENILTLAINTDNLMYQIDYKEVLQACSPISETILNLAINKDSLMTSNQYKIVLIDNSPLPQSILDQVVAGTPTMNSNHYDQVMAAQ